MNSQNELLEDAHMEPLEDFQKKLLEDSQKLLPEDFCKEHQEGPQKELMVDILLLNDS